MNDSMIPSVKMRMLNDLLEFGPLDLGNDTHVKGLYIGTTTLESGVTQPRLEMRTDWYPNSESKFPPGVKETHRL